jgi:hypothetical protein
LPYIIEHSLEAVEEYPELKVVIGELKKEIEFESAKK